MLRDTRYARNGSASIAFQILGTGPIDIVLGLGWRSHLDALWEEPRYAGFITRLAAFARVIVYDARGVGLSDAIPLGELITLDDRAEDLRCVIEAAGAEHPALVAIGASGLASIRFATTYPERARALVLVGCAATGDVRGASGGTGPALLDLATIAPSAAHEPSFTAWWTAYNRRCAGPGATDALVGMNDAGDVLMDLPSLQLPTLVLHRTGDRIVPIERGRALAAAIPGAVLRELPGEDHMPFIGDQELIVAEIEQFLTGKRRTPKLDSVLATVVVVDVDSAETALILGDSRWTELWTRFRAVLNEELQAQQGRRLFSTMTGVVASFETPLRAIEFAQRTVASAQPLGLIARAGLHSGELVVRTGVAGVAVHLAARVAGLAAPGETLVSDTVIGLVSGSALTFEPAGEHPMPGQPGEWRLFRLAREGGQASVAAYRTRAERPTMGLSRREREIASLLALGLSNRQIADELVISVATVERHVANMLAKLGYHSRTQIAAWAVDHGLLTTTP